MLKLSPYAILQGDSTTGVYTDAYFHHVPFQQIEQFRSTHLSLITLLEQVDGAQLRKQHVSLREALVQSSASSSEDSV